MWNSVLNSLGLAIGSQVVAYLKEHAKEQQFESMQAEILEGWVYKIQVAIRDEHRRNNVPLEVHKKVMERVEEVVREEFDTTKL